MRTQVHGNAGDDWVMVSGGGSPLTVNGGAGNDRVMAGATTMKSSLTAATATTC